MQRIVVAAKAGADEPWLADAAASLAEQTGAEVSVVSVDGLDVEMGSTMPRSEYTEMARRSAEAVAQRIREAGVDAEAEVRPGKVVPGVRIFAEERDADLILVGASKRGPVAKRVLGDVSLELVRRSRRPVMVIAPPD
jgi:nucleotide-binding universal stress UspA family protein